jgi:hypothetical protein
MLELATNLIIKAISAMPVEINPITLDFCKHYVFGKQQPRILPEELKKYTLIHVVKSLCDVAAFSPSTMWGNATWYPYKGDDSWYTHPTMGVVGGFIYKLVSYEDKFIIKCQDEWDFNTHLSYDIPLPNGVDWSLIRPILKRVLGGKFNPVKDEYGEKVISFGISEQWLAQFNDNHKFTTTWELELPSGMCMPINHPLKDTWAREQRTNSRKRTKSKFRPL